MGCDGIESGYISESKLAESVLKDSDTGGIGRTRVGTCVDGFDNVVDLRGY